jgi:ethanolamine-phosphate cytidylyltransferase
VLGAPYSVNESVLQQFERVDIVIHGSTEIDRDLNSNHPYEYAIQQGIFKQIESPMPHLTTDHIIKRIIEHRKVYEERNRKKAEKVRQGNDIYSRPD